MTVEERVQNLKNNGATTVSSFGKSMPDEFSSDSMLNVGDLLVFPDKMPEILHRVFGKKADGSDAFGEFIVITKINAADKTEVPYEFYPSSFTKNYWPAKIVDGQVETELDGGPLHPKGTAVDKFLEFRGKGTADKTDTQLGVEYFLHRSVKISDLTPINTQKWNRNVPLNQLRKQHIPTYDLEA